MAAHKCALLLLVLCTIWPCVSASLYSLGTARNDLAGASAGSIVMWGGGAGIGVNIQVDFFNQQTLAMNASLTLSVARGVINGAGAGNFILIGGGVTSVFPSTVTSKVVDIFNVANPSSIVRVASAFPSNVARYYCPAGSAGSHVLFAGGNGGSGAVATVDVYDVAAQAWLINPPALSVARLRACVVGDGGLIIIAGGYTDSSGTVPSAATDFWNTGTAQITAGSPISVARGNMRCAATNGVFVFTGGDASGVNGNAVNNVDIYFVSNSSWVIGRPLVTARRNHACGAAGNLVVCAGGSSGGTTVLQDVEIYNVVTNVWTYANPNSGLSVAREALAAGVIGPYVMFGGGAVSTLSSSKVIDIFDTSNMSWLQSITSAPPTSAPTTPPPTTPTVTTPAPTTPAPTTPAPTTPAPTTPAPTTPAPTTPAPTTPAPTTTTSTGVPSPATTQPVTTTPNPIITEPPTTAPTCVAPPPVAGAVCVGTQWVFNGNISAVTVVNGPVTINGSLSAPTGITITVQGAGNAPTVVVIGAAAVSGTVVISLQTLPANGEVIQVISAANFTGNVTDVSIIPGYAQTCKKVTGAPQSTAGGLSVVLTVDSSGCRNKGGVPPAAIGGIVGGVCLLAIGAGAFLAFSRHAAWARNIFLKPRVPRPRSRREQMISTV